MSENAAITASRAVASDANGQLVASSTTATELGYVNGVTSAIQTQLDGKMTNIEPATNEILYVNSLAGTNAAGCGDYGNPCATIVYAMTLITDSSQNKPYVIKMLANRQIETADILVKPYVSIVGEGQRATYLRINGGGAIKPDTSLSTSTSWNLFSNFYLGGGTPFNWDLQAIGGSNNTLVLQNMTLGGAFTIKGRNAGGGDFLESYTMLYAGGSFTVDSAYYQIQTGEIGPAAVFTNTQAVAGLSGNLNNMILDTSAAISDQLVYMNNVAWAGTSTLTTSGTTTLDSYKSLPPKSRRTIGGTTTLTERDDPTSIKYVPTTSGNWTSAPTDVQEGLDNIAAQAVKTITIASANGITGSSSGGITPALTIGTSITGLVKGNGSAFSAAVSGTDYAPATTGSAYLKGNGAGGFTNQSAPIPVRMAAQTLPLR
jgi:hypothetical protein